MSLTLRLIIIPLIFLGCFAQSIGSAQRTDSKENQGEEKQKGSTKAGEKRNISAASNSEVSGSSASCIAMSTGTGDDKSISLLIKGMSDEDSSRAATNMLILYAIGEKCIPALLDAGLSEKRVAFSFPYPSILSGIPTNEEVHPTVGIVSLYLVESIMKRHLFHSGISAKNYRSQRDTLQAYKVWWTLYCEGKGGAFPDVGWDHLCRSIAELQAFLVLNNMCSMKQQLQDRR